MKPMHLGMIRMSRIRGLIGFFIVAFRMLLIPNPIYRIVVTPDGEYMDAPGSTLIDALKLVICGLNHFLHGVTYISKGKLIRINEHPAAVAEHVKQQRALQAFQTR